MGVDAAGKVSLFAINEHGIHLIDDRPWDIDVVQSRDDVLSCESALWEIQSISDVAGERGSDVGNASGMIEPAAGRAQCGSGASSP